jgi:hypothetical protein
MIESSQDWSSSFRPDFAHTQYLDILPEQARIGHTKQPYDETAASLMLQQAHISQSPTTTPDPVSLALDTPNMMAFQDHTGQIWTAAPMVPQLHPTIDQMADLQLVGTNTTSSSPIMPPDGYESGRLSFDSTAETADWQDKARTEVSTTSTRPGHVLTRDSGERFRTAQHSVLTESVRRRL